MKATVYNTKITFYVNPIYPDRRILVYNHEYYDIDNNPTPTEMYYFIKDIHTSNILKHHKLEDEYDLEDLKYIIEKLGIKNYRLNKAIKEENV